jgi:hypothetical protein
MTAEKLKEATMIGQVAPEAMVQQSGQPEWHEAAAVKGLEFSEESKQIAAEIKKQVIDTHPRFKTLRELLSNFLHHPVAINLVDADHFDEAELLLCCEDHFEINLPKRKVRAFVPYARIKAVASIELDEGGTQYSESHKVRIEVDPCKAFTATGD